MNTTTKLTALLTLFLTLGITSVSAAHTAQTSVDKQFVDDDSSDSYTFTVSNDGGSSNDIYKVVINSPSGFSISTSSCPTGWYKGDTTSSKLTCLTDPFGGKVISSGSSQEFTLEATSENPSSTTDYTWSITSTDSNGDKADSSAETTVDLDEPSSTASITSPANQEVTSDSPWTIEPTNVDDPTSSVEKVTLQYRKGSDWQDHNTKDHTQNVQFKFDPSSEDGLYEFRTVAKDKVKNSEDPSGADTSLTYDTTEPDVTITSPSSKVYRQPEGSVTVDFDYVEENPEEATLDAGSESQSIDGLDSGDSSDSIDLGNLPGEGKYNLKVTLGDLAGQSGSDTANDQLVVDGTAPTLEKAVTGGSLDGESTDRDAVTVEFTDALSGLDSGTVGTGDFQVGGSNGDTIEGKTVSGNTVTLDLDSELPRGATPSVMLTGEIEDKAGNVLGDSADPSVDAEDSLRPQNPESISFSSESVNKDNDENIDVDVNFGSAPEAGDVTLEVDDSDSDDDAVTFSKSASQTTTFSDKDLSSLDDGTLTATAKIMDDSDNTNSEGFTASQEIQKDTTDPVIQNAERQSETEFKFEVHDEGNGLDASTVESGDFILTNEDYSASFGVVTCNDEDPTCTVTATLSEPIDQDTLTVGFDGSASLSDVEGNIQSEDTVLVSGMDGVAPTLDSAERVEDTTIEATVSDSGVGLDESTFEKGDFSATPGSIESIQTNFQDEATPGTVTINLNSPVDSTSVEISLQSDGVSDMNSNSRTQGTAIAYKMDGVAPIIDNPKIEGDTPLSDGETVTVYATVNDDGAGVETVTADMSTFGASNDVTLTSEKDEGTDFDSDGDENSNVYGATVTLDESEATDGSQTATVTATDAAHDPNTADPAQTNPLEVDIVDPTVDSASITRSPISDSDTGDSQTVTVEFSEEMETSVTPTVQISGLDQGVTDVTDGSFESGNTWTGSVTINDNDEDTTATIEVSEAQDLAGNSLEEVNDNTFLVDTANPQKPSAVDFGVDYANIDNQNSVPYTVDFEEAVEQGTVHLTATGSGGDSVTADVEIDADDTSVTGNLDLSTLDEGEVDLSAQMTDQYGNPGETASTQDEVVKDTERPAAPVSVQAGTINTLNVDPYSVSVTLPDSHESGEVRVKLDGPDGETITGQSAVSSGTESADIGLGDVSALADTDSGESVKVETKFIDDAGNENQNGYTDGASTSVTKDTQKPTFDSVRTVSKRTLKADFSDDLNGNTDSPEDFSVGGYDVTDTETTGGDKVLLTLESEMPTDATPSVTANPDDSNTGDDELQDDAGNHVKTKTLEPSDGLAPEIQSVTTYDVEDGVGQGQTEAGEEGDGTVNGVTVEFTEQLQSVYSSELDFESHEVSGAELMEDSSKVRVELTEEIEGTGATPVLNLDPEAVQDDSGNNLETAKSIRSSDGAAPVLMSSEVNQDESDSDRTVLDLRFSEFVKASPDASATLSPAEGTLQFTEQTGTTLQATYHDSNGPAVLNTGEVYEETEGEETEMTEPEVEEFNGVKDVNHYIDAGADGADLDDYEAPSNSKCDVELNSIPSTLSETTGVDDNTVSSGDTVCVQTGTYHDVNLDVDVSDVKLAGLGATPSDTTLSATDSSDSGGHHTVVDVTADGVTVTGFEITDVEGENPEDGIVETTYPAFRTAHTDGVTASYLQVHENEGKQVVFTNAGTVEPTDATVKHVEAYDSTGGDDNEGSTSETDGITFWQVDGGSISHVTAYNNGDNGVYFNGNDLTGTDIVSYNNGDQGVDISLGDQTLNPTEGPVTITKIHSYDNDAPQIEVEKNGEQVSITHAVVEGANTGLRFDEGSAEVEVRSSRFEGSGQDVMNDASGILDSEENYFGKDGIQTSGSVDASYTTLNSAVNSQGTDIRTFTRNLSEGSNMVSFPIRQGRKPVSEVIEDGSDEEALSDSNVDTVWTYQNGQWRELATGYGDSEEDYFRGGLGYIFHMTDSDTLSVNVDHEYQQQEDSTPESLELSSIWNLVGSYQEFDQSEDSALSSLDDDYKAFNSELNCVEDMETGVGYWVTRTDNNGHTPTCS